MVEIPLETPTVSKLDFLMFDSENPRFAGNLEPDDKTDISIIKHFWNKENLSEIIKSFARNGFLRFEPIIILKEPKTLNNFVVIEGNRRLAALKILRDKDLAAECKLNIPENIHSSVLEEDLEVPIVRVKTRVNARPYLAIKHLKGPKGWEAFSKAKFCSEWYLEALENKKPISLTEIAEVTGDSTTMMKKWVNAFFALQQAIDNKAFYFSELPNDKKFPFSYFYEALIKKGFQEYLGLDPKWMKDIPTQNPIPKNKIKNLEEVLVWLFGKKSEGIAPLLPSQHIFLAQLDEIIANPQSLKVLKTTGNFDQAFFQKQESEKNESVSGDDEIFDGKKPKTSTLKPLIASRQTLAPNQKGYLYSISDQRLNALYLNLLKLKVAKLPSTAAVMNRVFLDLSTILYLNQKKIPVPDFLKKKGYKNWSESRGHLKEKVKIVLNDIDPHNTNTKLNDVRQGLGTTDWLHSIENLHRYLHTLDANPTPYEIKIIWDRLHPYFKEIFEALEE